MSDRSVFSLGLLLAAGLFAGGCAPAATSAGAVDTPAAQAGATTATSRVAAQEQPALKEVFAPHFMIGTALDTSQFSGRDVRAVEITRRHFNTITPENVMKWEVIHPEPDTYAFDLADRFVRFGEENEMFIVGHTLVWHSQAPEWVFQDAQGNPLSRDALLERMRDHIHTVVGRYKGRIHGWDVVNEALNEDGTLRQSPWLRIIGEDYLEHAFRFAHEADPQVELYYNDYSLENAPKRNGAVRIARNLQERGVRITGIGTQQHVKMDWPTVQQVDSTIAAFAELGLKVMVTELDVDVLPAATQDRGADVAQRAALQERLNPYREALPDSVQQALARRYAGLFEVYLKHRDAVSRVTFWGVHDAQSWLNNWPVRGRTSYPLLFDRQGQPKPAFEAVIRTARGAATR